MVQVGYITRCRSLRRDITYTCQCVVGYTGSTCEVDIDDCESTTCPSSSMCVDGVNTFECICLPGFEDLDNDCVPLQTGRVPPCKDNA